MSTTLITGASSGIGAELARRFARQGDQLILVARRRERLEALAEELEREHHVGVEIVEMDLSESSAAGELWERLSTRRVDTLVNNAGFGNGGTVVDADPELLEQEIRLNCLTLVGLTRRFLEPMIERGSGMIINIASTAAWQPVPNLAVYAATKAFVLSFTEALWAEARPHGVRAIAACPGPTRTEFFDHAGTEAQVGRLRTTGQFADALFEHLDGKNPSFIDGFANRMVAKGAAFIPKKLVLKIAGIATQSRRPK
ncbi:SDR family NAD(P)-dependent oxidoreductase [Kocuria sp. HSID16901]|uniref:SDR family NAD(P)-dependent oxidoreductase n=1 Tax=Kocuria sp. HSID16901 TaxID=2419505 RepID=UPI00065F8581|nr:SDR family NAD(P)-dependent oxidoreductase [Kocuria sp. HSID16901]MCT1367714.1 SDR family NAD(P)-dependent oxidoreductase [Rothia sp. p3-SID1597]RUQ20269.1 SDR family NAD(P)-dependent oxidoreductase [Kocuria sp. HSID16901]